MSLLDFSQRRQKPFMSRVPEIAQGTLCKGMLSNLFYGFSLCLWGLLLSRVDIWLVNLEPVILCKLQCPFYPRKRCNHCWLVFVWFCFLFLDTGLYMERGCKSNTSSVRRFVRRLTVNSCGWRLSGSLLLSLSRDWHICSVDWMKCWLLLCFSHVG